jgi:hypothetical protein
LFGHLPSVKTPVYCHSRQNCTKNQNSRCGPRVFRAAKSKPWMKHFGALSKLRKETRRIEKLIDKEFERINPGGFLDLCLG